MIKVQMEHLAIKFNSINSLVTNKFKPTIDIQYGKSMYM